MRETFTFRETALAAGILPGQLRGWLDRDQVPLDAVEDREGETSHRRFTIHDILRLALVAELVEHGVPVEAAGGIVEGAIGKNFRLLAGYRNRPDAVFVASMRPHTLHYWREAGIWTFALVPPEPEPDYPTTVTRTRLADVTAGVLERLG